MQARHQLRGIVLLTVWLGLLGACREVEPTLLALRNVDGRALPATMFGVNDQEQSQVLWSTLDFRRADTVIHRYQYRVLDRSGRAETLSIGEARYSRAGSQGRFILSRLAPAGMDSPTLIVDADTLIRAGSNWIWRDRTALEDSIVVRILVFSPSPSK